MPTDQLDLQAVAKADERFWAKHPDLHKRALTSDQPDARYRSEWLKLYQQAEQESAIPAPSVLPKPVPPPPPVNATSPVQACPGVASMTHEEKMEAAIHSANLGEDVLRELGDIKTLVATMVNVGGGLAVAGVAAAATGVGLLVEGVAAVGAGLLVAGAAMSGWQIGQGLDSLYDFFHQTRCDTATTPQQLHQAGKKFGEGVAKVGIGSINLLLSLLGGRGKNWRGLSIRATPLGFKSEAQFKNCMAELNEALKESGITDARQVGVRASAVTGQSSKGTAFRLTAQGGLPPSDVDVFIESDQLTSGMPKSKSIPGFVHPDRVMARYPTLEQWSAKWSGILGREITPAGFQPNMVPTGPKILGR